MNMCPVTSWEDLRQQAFDYVRHQKDVWAVDRLVPLEHGVLCPIIPERLQLGADVWTKIATPPLRFQVGLGLEMKTPSEWKYTHFHGDFDTALTTVHIDYFSVSTWGPLYGVSGFIVSSEKRILGGGGHWSAPPGGGHRSWPLGVLVGSEQLLTAYSVRSSKDTFKQQGDVFLCEAVTLWQKTNTEQTSETDSDLH